MEYNFRDLEKKWQAYWAKHRTFSVDHHSHKPKFYVLDMFPYPSGAGLHVGHPLGYIASDIFARYKRAQGFNVLHPMGYDAYGLPAEQYAIQTGQHPAITTQKNIERYREQLDKLGFSFDWEREVRTCDPQYYKWTQWTFMQLFNHWYCLRKNAAVPIEILIDTFQTQGNAKVRATSTETEIFSAEQWRSFPESKQDRILMNYRMAFLSEAMVNWCPELGTVLANDEVVNGLSVRGGHPVERRTMRQWSLRISAYAQRLLDGLDTLQWSDSLKEIQRNWIGRSEGCQMQFHIVNSDQNIDIFTTRADTIFGVTFMVFCPEHPLLKSLCSPEQATAVENYIQSAKNRTERERQADVQKVSGVFTGAYAKHPFNGNAIPIWVSDYVLAGYGTGAIMAVPAHDSRDYRFAKHFKLPITQVVDGPSVDTEAFEAKDGVMIQSDFINGLRVADAISEVVRRVESMGIGKGKINYRLRDAIFSRQRYWGEPFPVYFVDGMPRLIQQNDLPLTLPDVDKYLPTETGEPPLARALNWQYHGNPLDTNTMPGFAGSSAYYLRYMDPKNDQELVSKEANNYWQQVDLYIGGAEHATGHLIYARFWNKFLYDIGVACKEEPFKKLINQGMIQGRSNFVYRIVGSQTFVSLNLKDQYETQALHVDINMVNNDILDTEAFKQWRPEFENAEFILEDGQYFCGWEIEKMSKSMYNVQNPDDLVERYGADTLRMYEMFLGPLEQSKPWDTQGIEGVFRFIRKTWRLFHDDQNTFRVNDETPSAQELKTLHKTIQKISSDTERFSFNTAVSTFMIATNELTEQNCCKREILEPYTILMAPYMPHMAEELWTLLGHDTSISQIPFPAFEAQHIEENSFKYPISFNGKTRFFIELPLDLSSDQISKAATDSPEAQKWLDGKTPKKIIVVPRKIVNIVV